MALTNVELYEALKPSVGEAAAKMIAEVVPPTRELATKADTAALKTDIADLDAATKAQFAAVEHQFSLLRGEMNTSFEKMNTRFAEADGRIHAEGTRTIKWLLGFFVPVWLGTGGTVVAILLKGS